MDSTPSKSGQWHWLVIIIGVIATLWELSGNSALRQEFSQFPAMDMSPPFPIMVMIILCCVLAPVLACFFPWLVAESVWDSEEYPGILRRGMLYLCYFAWWIAFYQGIGVLIVVLPAMLPVFGIEGMVLGLMLSASVSHILIGWNGMRIFRPLLTRLKALQLEDQEEDENWETEV